MYDPTNRREFLKLSALASAGLLLYGRPASAGAAAAARPMGPLTTISLTDDALRVARHDAAISPAFRVSLATDMNVFEPLPGNAAFFAGLMPATLADVTALLKNVRARWTNEKPDHALQSRLALAAGWLVHRAADGVLGSAYTAAADAETAALYQDAAILRARSDGAVEEAPSEEVAALFREMVPRTLTRFHTLIPDYDDAEGWIARLVAWRGEHAARMERYGQAFAQPDPSALRRYVTQPNFYDPDDPVLLLSLRLRKAPDDVQVDLAGGDLRGESLYGRALTQAVRDILAASAYFEGELDGHRFEQRLIRK